MKMMQIWCQLENVAKTSGESNIFKGCNVAKREIVKIHWKFVSFLAPRNPLVRQTIGNVMRAERCKIEEISSK